MSRLWRWAAAAVILGALVGFGLLLVPHYRRHAAFQRVLERVARQAEGEPVPVEVLRTRVQDQAARLGLEVRAGHVRVRRTDSGVRLEVRYPVRLDLALYTVDLHFRAQAGR